MSDTMNAIISRPIGIDVLGNLKGYQDLAQAQAATALTQQQVQGAGIQNQASQLQLLGQQYRANLFLNALGGPQQTASPGAAAAPNVLANMPSSAPAAGSPASVPATGGAIGSIDSANQLAQISGIAPTPAGWGKPVPDGVAPATMQSAGMPAPGELLGQKVAPTGAVQTMYGVPLPAGYAAAIAFSKDPTTDLQQPMEARRQRLQELLGGGGDWSSNVAQAYQEGWMDPQHAQAVIARPDMKAAVLQGLSSPDAYQSNLEKYSGQGLRPDPVTGQLVVSPVSIQGKQDMAAAGASGEAAGKLPYVGATAQAQAAGTSAGELPLAGPLAAAKASGAASADTVTIPLPRPVIGQDGQPMMGADGQPMMQVQNVVMNKAQLAALAANGGTQPAAPSAPDARTNPLLGGAPNWVQRADGTYGPPSPLASPGPVQAAPAVAPGTGGEGVGVARGPNALGQQAVSAPAPGNFRPGVAALPGIVAPGAQPTAPTLPGISTGMPVLTPPQAAALEVQKSAQTAANASDINAMQGYRTEVAKTAQAAQQQNAILDQMRTEAAQFNQGSFADYTQGMKKAWGSIAQSFGTAMPASVSSWEDFGKNAGAITRTAAAQVSPRVGVQELQLIQKFLPSTTMSPQGFSRIADQMQGLNDYQVARNAAAANFTGNPSQFESQFASAVTPAAFIVSRMPASDLHTFVAGLSQTADGRATLSRIANGISYAKQAGWLNAPVAGAQ